MKLKRGTPVSPSPDLRGLDARKVDFLLTGRSGDALSGDNPAGFDEIEYAIGEQSEADWARYRSALLAEAARRGIAPGATWGEQTCDPRPTPIANNPDAKPLGWRDDGD